MRPTIRPADVESWGVPLRPAKETATGIEEASRRFPGALDPRGQERFWLTLRSLLLTNPAARWRFAAHLALYRLAYDGRHPEDGPGPAWVPSRADLHSSNIGRVMAARRLTSFEDFRRWSVDRREDYWSTMIRTLGIVFRTSPTRILKLPADPRHPEWLAGAQLNIAESCFNAAPNKAAILFGLEGSDAIRKMTYGQLHRLSSRIANGLDALGLHRGERIALFLPMTPEAVAAYIGIVLSGRCVVGIADAAAPPEFQKRSRIADAHAVFTVDSYLRDGKVHDIYSKVIDDDGPVHRGDHDPRIRRVRRPGPRHDARGRAETGPELEDGRNDGTPRLAPDSGVQLHRGAVDSGGDAVPHVPRGVPADRRILRRHGDRRRIHHRDRRAALRSSDVHDPGARPRPGDPRRGPPGRSRGGLPRPSVHRSLDRAPQL